jgi:hypothetical protein
MFNTMVRSRVALGPSRYGLVKKTLVYYVSKRVEAIHKILGSWLLGCYGEMGICLAVEYMQYTRYSNERVRTEKDDSNFVTCLGCWLGGYILHWGRCLDIISRELEQIF